MAALSYLGPFSFLRLSMPPLPPMEATEVERRAGVDGQTVYLLGKHGQEFSAHSFVDCDNLTAALQLRDAYMAKIGNIYPIRWGEIIFPYQVQILAVTTEERSVRRLLNCVGGVSSGKGAFLQATWQLLPLS
ncbi:MAG: hypothetical protein HC834_08060 [Rhodospirillales bacterium]|nr:hypothetical protein [Rhodospirillales bacterium]